MTGRNTSNLCGASAHSFIRKTARLPSIPPEAKAALKFMYDRRRAVYPSETVADLPEAKASRLTDGTAACIWGNLWGAPATSDAMWSKIELSPSPDQSRLPEL